ncbi:hypothetical protein C5E11_03990 [Clavibacter michiganensis]|nr:hypothetical protein [Clavibacter michiganensis]PPF64559.1 hypothetical protein C5E11_03990 [Clavibacter michiganensis]
MIANGADVAAIFAARPQVGVWNDEDQLQAYLHRSIENAGSLCSREIRLSDGKSRIDILIYTGADESMDGVGVEVKIKGSHADTLRQLQRYALCPEILELVLITTKASHLGMPDRLNGKPLTLIPLLEGGL